MSSIFIKIINKEIPSTIIYEDDFLICIKDINPKNEIHFLCIPKCEYRDYVEFINNVPDIQISHFFKKVSEIASEYCSSFNLQINNGANSGQEIFHFHLHIIGFKKK